MKEHKFDTLTLLKYAFIEEKDDPSKARKVFEYACKQYESNELQLIAETECCEFYIRQDMYLKAESLAKTICKEYPDKYAGYHCLFKSYMAKNQLVDARHILDETKNEHNSETLYLKDSILWLEASHRYSALIKELNTNPLYMEKMPEWSLWKLAKYYGIAKNTDQLIRVLEQLYHTYGVKDAGVALIMVKVISEQNDDAYALSKEMTEACQDDDISVNLYRVLEAAAAKLNGDYEVVHKDKAELQKWVDTYQIEDETLKELIQAL